MRAPLWKSARKVRKVQYNKNHKVQGEIAKNPYEAQLWRTVSTLRYTALAYGLNFLLGMNIVFYRVASTYALEMSHSHHVKF